MCVVLCNLLEVALVLESSLNALVQELLEKAEGVRENIDPVMVAEIISEKMLMDRICTQDQKTRFVALFAEILSNGGGEEDGRTQ